MPENFEKKDVTLPIKIPESLKHRLIGIGFEQDRPVGYVARELMIRGLYLFEIDGQLRGAPPSAKKGIPGTTLKIENSAKQKKTG